MARHLGSVALLMVMAGAACDGPAAQSFQPPRRVTCQEGDRALMGISRNKLLSPISAVEFHLAGFSVRPPASGHWCLALDWEGEVQALVGIAPRRAVMFVRNNFGDEVLSQPPPRQRTRHSFFVEAALATQRGGAPWTIASLRALSQRVAAESTIPPELTMAEVHRFGTDCLEVEMSVRFSPELRMHNQVLHCIHPEDARYHVMLMVSEAWIDGSPWYASPLIAAARSEYQPFLDSVRFTTPPEPRAQPPAPQRR